MFEQVLTSEPSKCALSKMQEHPRVSVSMTS